MSFLSPLVSSEETTGKQAASGPFGIQSKRESTNRTSAECRSICRSRDRRTPDRRGNNRRTPDRPMTLYRRSTDSYRPGLKDQIDSYRPPPNKHDPCRLTPIKQSGSSRALKAEKGSSPRVSTPRVLKLKGDAGLARSGKLGEGNEISSRSAAKSIACADLNNPKFLHIGLLPTCQSTAPSRTMAPHTVNAIHGTEVTSQPIQPYQSMEHLMEKKAILLGMRQRFFQVLQKKRDIANLVHHGCSKQYKHWLAYSSTWSTLCQS